MSTVRRTATGLAVLLGCVVGAWSAPVAAAPDPACRDQRVVMLMTTWCPYCRKATAFFNANAIKVLEIDIEKTDNTRVRAFKGRAAVPTILVGDTVVEGFSEERLRSLLCIE